MKVLVTGADGLLGSNLIRELLDKDYSVRVLIQPGSLSESLVGLDIETLQGDLLENGKLLEGAMSGCEAVFHCAAITDQWAIEDLTWKVNFGGTRRVLDACLATGISRLVFIGSASSFQYGTKEKPGNENSPYPEAYQGIAYMESKHRAMGLVETYIAKHGLDAVIGIPTFMLGSYDTRPSSGELIRQFITRGLKFTSPGGRNFGHVRDVASALVSIHQKGGKGEKYILGGENLSYMDFFSKVADIAGVDPPKFIVPGPMIRLLGSLGSTYEKVTGKRALMNSTIAKLSLMGTYYSSEKAIKALDMPQTSVEKAIEASLESLKQYGHL